MIIDYEYVATLLEKELEIWPASVYSLHNLDCYAF